MTIVGSGSQGTLMAPRVVQPRPAASPPRPQGSRRASSPASVPSSGHTSLGPATLALPSSSPPQVANHVRAVASAFPQRRSLGTFDVNREERVAVPGVPRQLAARAGTGTQATLQACPGRHSLAPSLCSTTACSNPAEFSPASTPPVPPLIVAPRASWPGAARLCSSRSASRSPPAAAHRSALVRMTEGSSPPVPPLVAAPRASSPGAVRLCSSRSASRSPPADAPRSALVTVTEVPEPFERQRWQDASAAVVAGVAAPCSLVAGTQHCEGTEVSAGSFKGMAQLQGQLLEVLDQQSQRLVGVLEATLERRGGDAGVDMGASSEEVWLEEMTIGSDGPCESARLAKAVEEPAIPTAAPGAPLPMREEMTVGSDGSCEIATPAKAVEEPAVPTAAAAVSSSPAVPTPVPLPTAAPAATGTPLPMPEEMTVWSNGSCEIATPAKAVEEATMPTAAPALSLLPASPAATGAPLSMREEITVGSNGSCEIAEPAKAVEEPTVPMAAPAVSSSPAAPAAAPPPTAAPAATGAPLPMWQDELQGLRAELRETSEEAVASMRHQLQALCEEQRSQLNRESSLVSQVSALKAELHGGRTAVTGTGGAVGTTAGSSTTAHGGNEEEGPLVAELLKRIADLEHTVKVQGEEKAQQAMAYTELNKAVLLDCERRAAQHDRDVVKTQQTLTVQALTLQAELAQTVAREREALDAERKSHACEVAQLRSELEDHRRQAHHHSDGGGRGGGAFGVIGHVDSHKTALAQLRRPPPPPPCQVVLQGGPTCQHQKCLRDEGVAAAAVVAIPPIAPVPGGGSLDLEDTDDNMFHEVLSLADEAVTTNDR